MAEDRRNDRYEKDRVSMNEAIKTGALIGGGILAFRNRRALGQGIRRLGNATIDQAGRAYTSAASSLLTNSHLGESLGRYKRFGLALSDGLGKQTGVFRATKNVFNPNGTEFTSRYNASVERQIMHKAQKNVSPVHQNSTAMSQWYFNETHTRAKQRSGEAFKLAQHDQIKKAFQQNMSEQHRNNLYQLLIEHEKKNGTNLFNAPTLDKVADFVQANTGRNAADNNISLSLYGENEAKEFVNKLTNILTRHKSPNAVGMRGQKEVINRYEENIRKVEEDAFKRAFSKDKNRTTQSELLSRGGYRQITFADHRDFNLQIDNMRVPTKEGKNKEVNIIDEIQRKYGSKMNLDELIVDKNIYINDGGEVLDMRGHNKGMYKAASFMQDAFQVPFLRFNFLDLAHFSTIRSVKEMPRIQMLGAGETYGFVQHKLSTFTQNVEKMNATAIAKPLDRGGYMYAEGNMYDIKTGKIVDENIYAGPQNFGPLGRMHNSIMNLREQAEPNRGFLKRLFDVGAQQQDSFWTSARGAIEKFADPTYAPNLQNSIALTQNLPKEERISKLKEYYGRMYGTMHANAMELSPEAVNYISPQINQAFFKARMNIDVRDLVRDENVMNALGEIVQKTKKGGNPNVFYSSKGTQEPDGVVSEIHDMWRRYVNDPNGTLKARDMEPDKSIALPDTIAPMQLHEPNLIKSTERARRLIHQYAINQMEMGTTETGMARRLIYEGKLNGVLTFNDVKQVRQLDTLNEVRNFHDGIYSGERDTEEKALNEFASAVTTNPQLALDVQTTTKEFQPWYAAAPQETKGSVTGSNIQYYRKHKSYQSKLSEINERYKQEGKTDPLYAFTKHGEAVWDTMRELFAGRKNPSEVTTMTAFPFYYAERLDNAVSGLGGGLSQTHRGSAASIIGNQFLRRIAMPYMAYQQAVWLDGQFNDIGSDTLGETYVNMHSDVADFKEFTGINRVMRSWSRVFEGADQIADSPFVKPFNFLTLGAFSDWRSGDDVRKYYESGEEDVRKNRYWGVGSGSPWAGTGVEYFQPNWYRRMKSDYKFTDTMYGSESEYWANNWMPTLTHPFAPINHFFLDPYHYENKHKKDRPYAVTGGFSEIQQIPLIGPALDGTIGRILKPRQDHPGLEKAHRKYIADVNANVKAKYDELSDGHFIQRGVAGGVNILEAPNLKTADSPTSEEEARISALVGGDDEDESAFSASSITSIGGGGGGRSGTIGSGGNGGVAVAGSGAMAGSGQNVIGMSDLAQMDLSSRNQLLSAGGTGAPALALDRYNKLLNPNIVVNSNDIGMVDNASGILRDAFYSASEIGGMYGFMTKTAIGFEESGRGATWAPSSLMTSYSRQFWDMSLGGLGGQISEIGRRYVPRDPNKQYYSPIENTMPEWLPGLDYFLDFKHGDPYLKVKKGEMRLPGEAYTTFHDLHPDGTGQGEWADYGIFDRFRILSDVAPYSNQYKQAKSVVSKMNQAGLLSDDMIDEYEEIRDQVRARKEKYRWYNKRFLNADVKEETVHVTSVLDQNTFLTKEYGSNPIRLAGVKLSKDDEEAVSWLSQFIKPGAALRIGTDGDPNSRINDDTMNTMSAVVYAPHGEEGGSFSYSIKGQSLNYILANRKWTDGSEVRVKDNESSVATYALFTSDMRFVGRQWERLTHDILPKIPVVGVFADKFLQVRTPLESYERDQVYGKEWKPWTEPIKSWLIPMAQTITSRNPLIAAAEGAGIGHLMTKQKMRGRGRIVGAAIGGLMATARVLGEKADSLVGDDRSTWIPERRKTEREINEYFDRLKYVKYKGLYEKARRIAQKEEGVDVEKFFDDASERGVANKGLRKYIADKKKWLSMAKKSGYGSSEAVDAQLDELGKNLDTVESDKTISHAGPYATLAMQYRKEYESTLYGLDPKTGDMRDVLKALTPKEREYFPEFLKANNAKDRKRIIDIVPDDMRRLLQAKWGMDIDKKKDIATYFREHNLPNANWEGWGPNTSLDNIKIKVMKNQGVELSESGYWADDSKRAEQSGVEAIPLNSLSSRIDVTRLQEVLRGAGLSDVRVTMNIGQGNGKNQISTALNIVKDVKNDITRELNNNIQNIFST